MWEKLSIKIVIALYLLFALNGSFCASSSSNSYECVNLFAYATDNFFSLWVAKENL